MVPFEKALVSSYRPSIVTLPLSLRVSEISPLLFSRTPLFPTPPLVSPKFPHVPLGVCGSPFRYKERKCWANCASSFQCKISNLCDHNPPTLQADIRTDGRTTCDPKTSLCTKLHCAGSSFQLDTLSTRIASRAARYICCCCRKPARGQTRDRHDLPPAKVTVPN